MSFPLIDVIIPAYNAAETLLRAVLSTLEQPYLGKIWLVDDGSTDNTLAIMTALADQYPDKIQVEAMPRNGGVAKARNWGALQAQSEFIAFLDADDIYEPKALEVASSVFHFCPELSVLRLDLKPFGMPERYLSHPNFDFAWQHMRMTCGGNLVFRRSFFLACGGFPQDQLFRDIGGEDGALGLATSAISTVATTFGEPGVVHFCREGMHAERLLNVVLFNQMPEEVTPEKIDYANGVTEKICQRINQLKYSLEKSGTGLRHLTITRGNE